MFMENKTEKKQTMPKKPDVSKSRECNDENCPIHGSLKLRGRTFTEKVVSAKSHRTSTIEIKTRHYIPKYERYEKRKTRLQVHNPDCINAKEGDVVKVQECRPISKTKHFVIIKKVK
jgi:small subunit ribosomal protein S17